VAAETVPIRSMSAAELRALAHPLRLQLLQVLHGNHYLTQEEFSNLDFFNTGLGCLQSE
jgi:hypothetical protein